MQDQVSIHAPRTGRDVYHSFVNPHLLSFNPRAPYRARLCWRLVICMKIEFQSTRPVQGATFPQQHPNFLIIVSIHAPRTGRDRTDPIHVSRECLFQSTRPVQGATRSYLMMQTIQPGFNPRAPYRARRVTPHDISVACSFNPRAPYRARQPAN